MRPVELSDRELFDAALAKMGTQSYEACFPNIFMYREPYGIEFVEIKGRLVVSERATRTIHYPLGEKTDPESLYWISKAFKDAGLTVPSMAKAHSRRQSVFVLKTHTSI